MIKLGKRRLGCIVVDFKAGIKNSLVNRDVCVNRVSGTLMNVKIKHWNIADDQPKFKGNYILR